MSRTDVAVDATMVERERGWLVSALIQADAIFGSGRIEWWCEACALGALPQSPIPQIAFRSSRDAAVRPELADVSRHIAECGLYKGPPLSPDGARRHVEGLVAQLGGGWEGLLYFIRWLGWGLGVRSEAPRAYGASDSATWNGILYREFHLPRLLAAQCDVLGDILAERHGSGWNPNAFYPTPMEVCTCMVNMLADNPGATLEDGRDARLASVLDPCVGTGRMLLAASNHSVNLWGCDIDQTMVDACAINLALFAPWGVYMPARARQLLGRSGPTLAGDQACLQAADEQRQAQGHPPLPHEDVVLEAVLHDGSPAPHDGEIQRIYAFNRHGQGELFSVPEKKGGNHD